MATQLLETDLSLNGHVLQHSVFNALASGGLHGNGTNNEVPLLDDMCTKALGSASEAVVEFPLGRYFIGSNYTKHGYRNRK